ncbi:MAG TPA: c-type cytochrome [Syntrophobacteria bacterium]|nr:c-type cytochrome [Syntrophobacteria bacterium]
MRRVLKMVWLWAPLIIISLTSASVPAADKADPKALFEARCSTCHPLSRPLGKKMTAAEWRETVMRMKGLAGGKISDAEAEAIIKYLNETRGK